MTKICLNNFVYIFNILNLVCLILLQTSHINGLVEIISPFYPWYVKGGDTLTIVCQETSTTNTPNLQWSRRKSPNAIEIDIEIQKLESQWKNFYIRNVFEYPTGYAQSNLTKLNVTFDDRGVYTCRDGNNNYDVYVTVLFVQSNVVEATTSTTNSAVFNCQISGFESNPPGMVLTWYYVKPGSSPLVIQSNSRYNITQNGDTHQLIVLNPTKADSGSYVCNYTLATNLGSVSISQSVQYTSNVLSAGNNQSAIDGSLTFFLFIFISMLFY